MWKLMAKNLELREKISGSFDNANSLIYFRSHVDQVDELLVGGKLNLALVPSSLLETRKMAGVITSDIDLDEAYDLIDQFHEQATSLYPGSYLVSQGKHVIESYSGHFIQYSDDGQPAGADVQLENGDMLYYIKQGSAYNWGEVAVEVFGTIISGAYVFASIAEMSEKVALTAGVSAVVTGYKWIPSDADAYAAATTTIDKTGSVTVPTRWDINDEQAPMAGAWESSGGNHVLKYNGGAGNSYWRLEEVIPGGYPDNLFGTGTVGMYKSVVNPTQHIWGVINNSYNIATEQAQGLMSPGMVTKLLGIEANANKYIHHTQSAISIDADVDETINTVTIDTEGHVTGFTKQPIRTGTSSLKGILELATDTEMKTGTDTARASTPAGVKAAIQYFSGLKIYNSIATDLATANAAHPNGAVALFTS